MTSLANRLEVRPFEGEVRIISSLFDMMHIYGCLDSAGLRTLEAQGILG
jgi:hypothetical protein